MRGSGRLVVKASDRGWRVKSSSPVPLETRRVGNDVNVHTALGKAALAKAAKPHNDTGPCSKRRDSRVSLFSRRNFFCAVGNTRKNTNDRLTRAAEILSIWNDVMDEV
ncbi:hypothetical protein TNCV_2847031 [Trichonephila clavipes]|nr:hypothetical protein TNCV_2847031 [Trichonephila clavipes]